jgi:16S rRNA C967 or C1407 C5-methylase (RsmB/RsmF family)
VKRVSTFHSDRYFARIDPVFHAGAYYVQEASSMFLCEALRQTVDTLRRRRI